MNQKEMTKRMKEVFGDRLQMLGQMILHLSMSGQPCDVTFYKREPAIDVKIDPQISLALCYGAGAKKLHEMLSNIRLSGGEVVSITDIWSIHPMPVGGFSQKELDDVDLADGEKKFGPQGETVREMIRAVYKCKTKAEEEKYLRRYLAS
ncbi:MAG TPA: hypothetical protein VFW94_04295 [Candidatus Acidoferrales bacterium]|nr:hypothetical protein [Candidatus Acidoferrales bacterium]